MAFLADPPDVPVRVGTSGREPTAATRVFLWSGGIVAGLEKVNAVAALEGGIDRIKISGNGRVLAFNTRLGGTYLYEFATSLAHGIELGMPPVPRSPALDTDATLLAWLEGRGLDRRKVFYIKLATASLPAPSPELLRLEFLTADEGPFRVAEANLVGGPLILSVSPKKDYLFCTSFDLDRGIFRFHRYYYGTGIVQLLTAMNLAAFSSSPLLSDRFGAGSSGE